MKISNAQLKIDSASGQTHSDVLVWNAPETLKWSWSLRILDPDKAYYFHDQNRAKPKIGDVALVRIDKISNHTKMITARSERLRLHHNDIIVGVFGNRYATDAFEAEVHGLEQLHLLTNAGMIGTMLSKNQKVKFPTQVTFLGYLTDKEGQTVNIKEVLFPAVVADSRHQNVVLVVGSGMNSGKTSTASKLVKALLKRGLRVSICKLTGSVSPGDLFEYHSTSAQDVRDFSDYGFPSTYLSERQELIGLFYTMLADASRVKPDVIIMEIADGILQRETKMLLQAPEIKQHTCGVMLTATCAGSALFGIDKIQSYGHRVIGVSGVITNASLYVEEFQGNSQLPIAASWGDGSELAELVIREMGEAS
ncbi:MAG: hypothetical protein U9N83_12525 [Thermodesulfobacteriota bacterium]|nr:hypothetical protein [Thermodesulfobacteriota bacterium]